MFKLNKKFAAVLTPAVAVIILTGCSSTEESSVLSPATQSGAVSPSTNPLSSLTGEAPELAEPAQVNELAEAGTVGESTTETTPPADQSAEVSGPANGSEPLQPAEAAVEAITVKTGDTFDIPIRGLQIGDQKNYTGLGAIVDGGVIGKLKIVGETIPLAPRLTALKAGTTTVTVKVTRAGKLITTRQYKITVIK